MNNKIPWPDGKRFAFSVFDDPDADALESGRGLYSLLADLGARVIKIESPPDGDPYRYFAPGEYYSPNFAHLHRNKQSVYWV